MAHHFEPSAYSSVRVEDKDIVAELYADAVATYQPVNAQEVFACERIAIAQAMILRCGMLDAGFHTSFMNECVRPGGLPHNMIQNELARDIEVNRAQNRSLCLATGFDRLSRESDSFKLFIRYQANCRREYREAVEDMMRLLKLRDKLKAAPIELPKPVESELMDPPPPLTDDWDAASPYDPTRSIQTPVPQTSFPKLRIKARTTAKATANRKSKIIEPQPRFTGYLKGNETPRHLRDVEPQPDS